MSWRPSGWPGQRLGPWLEAAIERRLEPIIDRRIALELEHQRAAVADHGYRDVSGEVLLAAGSGRDRTLRAEPLGQLTAQLRALSGQPHLDWVISQAYRTLLECEGSGLGRIAGSTYNILGKLILPPLLHPPAGPVLEIGTLYGLFSVALMRQFRRVGDFRCLTVVDPLEGTQIQPGHVGGTDPTGTPVTAEVAMRNFAEGGLGQDEVRIICGYSTEADVREQTGDRRYATVIIDGDHSEEGVLADLWWVQDLLVPGGLVVVDDWGDGRWPGVQRAGRRFLAGGGRLQLLGTASTSAYLRTPD